MLTPTDPTGGTDTPPEEEERPQTETLFDFIEDLT